MKLTDPQTYALEAASRGALRALVNRDCVKVATVRALRVRGFIDGREEITDAGRIALAHVLALSDGSELRSGNGRSARAKETR